MTNKDAERHEAERLREAYRRRGEIERGLVANPGQRALVAERDRVLETLLWTYGPFAQMLDIGCGDGSVLASFRAQGLIQGGVGVDLLPERIAAAATGDPTLRFQVADAAALPFADATFDIVLAMTMFSSIPDIDRRLVILHEIGRVIRPGGIFAWYDMRRPNPWNRDVSPFVIDHVRRGLPGWAVRVRSLTLVPPIARRLGPLGGALYPVLAAVPALRTHSAGAAVKPGSR